jgi:tetrathionate reductase subunit B
MSKRYGMVIDLRKCVGCYSCQVSCKMENEVATSHFRSRVKTIYQGIYPNPKMDFVSLRCNQCGSPACIEACPTNATYQKDDGVVVVDYDKCIGCKNCVTICPYGARFMNAVHPDRKNKADKCNFCEHRTAVGLEPACARNCMGKAIYFGDLNDGTSTVSKLLKKNTTQVLKPGFNTDPKIYYIVDHKNKAE